jgi:hypothetical protein
MILIAIKRNLGVKYKMDVIPLQQIFGKQQTTCSRTQELHSNVVPFLL